MKHIWLFLAVFSICSISVTSHATRIRSFSLIDVATSKPVDGYDPIADGAIIDLAPLSKNGLSIRANTDATTSSVRFILNQEAVFTANNKPYALCGMFPGNKNYVPCPKLVVGSHSLRAQPYSGDNGTGNRGAIYTVAFTIVDSSAVPDPDACVKTRALWLWTTVSEFMGNNAAQDKLIQSSMSAGITDIYAYLTPTDYVNYQNSLRAFIAKLRIAGIRVWGMDGYRGYFSDSYGPFGLYASVDALIVYNSRVAETEKFVGFHSDMEPQDGQTNEAPPTFHNGVPDSVLNIFSGGYWYVSQALDREMLMRDWLQIHATIKQKLKNVGLKFGAAMPSWTDNYYGEEVQVTYNGFRQGVMKHMMNIIDEYVIMSYNTTPSNVVARISGELSYAETMLSSVRPKVFGALETHTGVGSGISYGDTLGKNNQRAVMNDISLISSIVSTYNSFCGISIHDWDGWIALPAQ